MLEYGYVTSDDGDSNASSEITGSGTANVITMFTAAQVIGNGTWEFSGNTIRPITTGSNIGDDTHRVGTIYMSSVLDYATTLTWVRASSTNMTLDASGNLGIGVTPTARLHAKGSTSDSTAYGLKVDSLAGSNWFNVKNDGEVNINGGAAVGSTFSVLQRSFVLSSIIDVYNATASKYYIRATDNGSAGSLILGNDALQINTYTENVAIGTPGAARFRVFGNVGAQDILAITPLGGSGGFLINDDGLNNPIMYMQDATAATTVQIKTSGVSFIGGGALNMTATAGNGYFGIVAQSIAPSASAATGLRLYANSTGAFSWVRKDAVSDTFTRTLDGTLTANRVYTLPDADITFLGRTGTNAAGQIAYFSDANQVTTNTNFVFDSSNGGLIVGGTTLVATANDVANFIRNQNATSRFYVQNNSTGISAVIQNTVSNGTYAISSGVFGTAYSGSALGIVAANYSFVASNALNGMMIYTSNGSPIIFGTNNTENIRILNGGAFLQGRTTVITSGDTAIFHRNQNDGSYVWASNNTSGTAGQAGFVATANSGTTNGALRALSAGFTTSGILVASTCTISTNATAGMNIGTTSNTQFSIWTNNTQYISVTATGRTFFGGATTATALIHLAAGTATASTAPLKFTTGTLLTAAEVGAMEYTSPTLYFTNGGGQRQEIIQSQQSRVSTQFDKIDTTLANVTGLTATLVASGLYRFEAILFIDASVSGGSKYAIAGTATATAIIYEILLIDNTSNLNTITSRQTALAGSAGQTGTTSGFVKITGLINVSGAGTLTVQFAQNAASGTSSVLVGSSLVVNQTS